MPQHNSHGCSQICWRDCAQRNISKTNSHENGKLFRNSPYRKLMNRTSFSLRNGRLRWEPQHLRGRLGDPSAQRRVVPAPHVAKETTRQACSEATAESRTARTQPLLE